MHIAPNAAYEKEPDHSVVIGNPEISQGPPAPADLFEAAGVLAPTSPVPRKRRTPKLVISNPEIIPPPRMRPRSQAEPQPQSPQVAEETVIFEGAAFKSKTGHTFLHGKYSRWSRGKPNDANLPLFRWALLKAAAKIGGVLLVTAIDGALNPVRNPQTKPPATDMRQLVPSPTRLAARPKQVLKRRPAPGDKDEAYTFDELISNLKKVFSPPPVAHR